MKQYVTCLLSCQQMPALECVTVGDQNGLARGAAVASCKFFLNPLVDFGERVAKKHLAQKVLRCGDRVRATEVKNLKGVIVNLKGHVEGAIHLGDGIVCIGSRLSDDKYGMHGIQQLSPLIGQNAQNEAVIAVLM